MPSAISSKSRQLLKHTGLFKCYFKTNDGKIDLTKFEDAIHQIAKLTSDTVEVKGLTQADICITYIRRSKVVENVSQ